MVPVHYKSLSGGADPDQEGIDLRMSAIKHKILVVSGKGGNLCILSTVLIEWMTHQKNITIYNMCSCCRSWQIHCCSSAQYGIITDEKVGRFLLWKSSWGQQHRPFVAMAQDIVEVTWHIIQSWDLWRMREPRRDLAMEFLVHHPVVCRLALWMLIFVVQVFLSWWELKAKKLSTHNMDGSLWS